MTKEINIDDLEVYIKALHCPIRWDILKVLKKGPKTSEQIYEILKQAEQGKEASNDMQKEGECNGLCLHANHKDLKKPTLYYHLRELESAGIIEGTKIIDEIGTILKEKEWKLTIKVLRIKLG